jgi:hypothetical protein
MNITSEWLNRITPDEQRWSESSDEKLYKIAKNIWSKKYTTEQLRSFQSQYREIISHIPFFTGGKKFICYQNMLNCVTFAISIREFGE